MEYRSIFLAATVFDNGDVLETHLIESVDSELIDTNGQVIPIGERQFHLATSAEGAANWAIIADYNQGVPLNVILATLMTMFSAVPIDGSPEVSAILKELFPGFNQEGDDDASLSVSGETA